MNLRVHSFYHYTVFTTIFGSLMKINYFNLSSTAAKLNIWLNTVQKYKFIVSQSIQRFQIY